MAKFHVPDAILLKFRPFLRNSIRVWPTDGRTDGRTDTPSYRAARTHLKIWKQNLTNKNNRRRDVNVWKKRTTKKKRKKNEWKPKKSDGGCRSRLIQVSTSQFLFSHSFLLTRKWEALIATQHACGCGMPVDVAISSFFFSKLPSHWEPFRPACVFNDWSVFFPHTASPH